MSRFRINASCALNDGMGELIFREVDSTAFIPRLSFFQPGLCHIDG